MFRRLFLLASLAAFAMGTALPAAKAAVVEQPFMQAAFDQAKSAGKSVLVAIHAPWCPICAKQKPILAGLESDPAFAALTVFVVDFDNQKDIVAALGANKQSTLISFHGTAERGRSVGMTDAGDIKALVAKALN
jgi:thiol-disulfide isomerase/thioredoxin